MSKIEQAPIFINGANVILKYTGFDEEIDVDDLTKIHYDNLFGEAVSVSALLNKTGILKADAEEYYERKKLEADIYEANLRKRWRRESNLTGGKFTLTIEGEEPEQIKLTEKSLDEAVLLDPACQVHRNNVITAKSTLAKIDSLFWSVSSKDKKLNNIMKEVTPEEFANEVIEGKINGMMIRKHTPIQERRKMIRREE